MLVYLSKKIAIPNDTLVSSLAWHSLEGWLVVGGKNGLLRVLKLETQQQDKDTKIKGLAAPSVLTMNQTLEGHHQPVVGVAWNEKEARLTTCDANGLIIVWVLYKNTWTQEMINNRNKSAVSMINWNKDGSKICIVYEDGAIIVGSVDGNRLWAKELKGTPLTHVQWSPDSKVLLFGTAKGEILVYSSHGMYNSKIILHCLNGCTGPVRLVGLAWYNGINGYTTPNCACLAVTFDNGRTQIMRDELDNDPVLVSTDIQVAVTSWNSNGSILAVAGAQLNQGDKEISTVLFYSQSGEALSVLRLPGKGLCAVAWEGSGLRIAVGIGGHIYFANIRHDYKWGYFSNTIVYTYRRGGAREDCCVFWNTVNNDKNCKTCNKLLHISSCADYGLLATQNDNSEPQRKYALLVCNSLGIPVDSKYIPIEPTHVCISQTHVIAVLGNAVFVWHYRTITRLAAPEFNTAVSQAIETQTRLFHVDDKCTGVAEGKVDFKRAKKDTSDPVCALCASEKVLIVGRCSGTLQCYTLPQVVLDHTFTVKCRPHLLSLNSDSSKLSIVDNGGVLSLYTMVGDETGTQLSLERKEVWGLKWAEDNPDQFAVMEKTRMYIFRGLDPEEPLISSASICSFKELQVKAVLMDEINKSPENPSDDLVFTLDTKSLRDTRQLLAHVTFEDSFQFIQKNPHPRLWNLLAESAIEKNNYIMAEKAYVCCQDYQGIQLIKRLKKLDTTEKQTAEVFAHMKKFDDAERTYIQMDRKDLALSLRTKLGDWFRVVQLLKVSGGLVGDDKQMTQTWNAIGDYYAERLMWDHAVAYYTQAGNIEKMAEGYYILEDFTELERLLGGLPDDHALLESLADQFMSVGMCSAAVKAFLKCHKIKAAVDCCIELNQWDEATSLAMTYGMKEVESLLEKYAAELMEADKILLLIQLYRKAKRFADAADLLHKTAILAEKRGLSPSKLKKLHVLSGLMIEEHHKHIKEKQLAKEKNTDKKQEVQSTLQGLLEAETGFSSYGTLIDNAWRGAECYHLYMLAQRQLYNRHYEDSMKTSLILQSYSDVISPIKIFSLLALSSHHSKNQYVCSQAFTQLEMLANVKEPYELLAVDLFQSRVPRKIPSPVTCPSCDTPVEQWSGACPGCGTRLMLCMASGHVIQSYSSISCSSCGHRIARDSIDLNIELCPLCHSSLINFQ